MNESVQLTVEGMKCGGCEANVTKKLTALDGVVSANASFKDNSVIIDYDADRTDLDTLKKIITDAGFTVE